jgi:hypothetical protein
LRPGCQGGFEYPGLIHTSKRDTICLNLQNEIPVNPDFH